MEENKKIETPVETTPIAEVIEETVANDSAKPNDVIDVVDDNVESVVNEDFAADVEVEVIDNRDKQAEELIKWGAARAGVVVITPLLGTVALIANEVYMIAKIAEIYDEKVARKSVLAFLGSLGGTIFGNLVATLLPLPFMQLPIAMSVTYGVGKAAQRWIKDGQPDNLKPYLEVFEHEKEEASIDELKHNPDKDMPLGDEGADFSKDIKQAITDFYPVTAHELFNELTDNMVDAVNQAGNKAVETLKKAGVTEEQINDVKFRAIAAKEVTEETAQKAAEEFKVAAKVNVKKLSQEAVEQAKALKEQAKLNLEVMKAKAAALKADAKVKEAEARLRAEKAKQAAKVQVQMAKEQAEEVKAEMKKKSEEAANRAAQLKETIKAKALDYKDATEEARENLKQVAEDFQNKVEERASAYQEMVAGKAEHSVEEKSFDKADTEVMEDKE